MLGLATPTDDAWVETALADIDALLADHAHCEMKAASNALSLAVRHCHRPELVAALSAVAEEEISHFRRVHALLVARRAPLGVPPVDRYAGALRRAASRTPRFGGAAEVSAQLIDRLLVGALIEARSCERFQLLSERVPDAALRAFYAELLAAEAGHYRTFVDLALAEARRDGVDPGEVRARLRELADVEAGIVRSLVGGEVRASMHG